MLESVQVPEQHSVVPLIRDGMIDLLPSRPKITYLINRVLRSRSRRLDAKDTFAQRLRQEKKEEKENR